MAWTGSGVSAANRLREAEAEDSPVEAEWARAFELWLAEKAPNIQRAYRRAWDDSCEFTKKMPQVLLSADVQAWVEGLVQWALDPTVLLGLERAGRRNGNGPRGLPPSTTSLWLSTVSSFVGFMTTRYTVAAARSSGLARW